ncbi:MAG: dephospho-CoA kinase [Woeseiaceae bacterium]
MPLRIGLTGGIASGKSTVADLFAELGAAVIDTDVIAREVVAPGTPALNEIADEFGTGVIGADGALNRAALRSIVFSDHAARKRLEAITHPRIGEETRRQSDYADGKYQLIVVPLLVNSALRGFVDRILVVDCEEDTQIRRLVARDGGSEAEARRILEAQASRTERLAIADDVICNDGDVSELRQQVAALHEIYLTLA